MKCKQGGETSRGAKLEGAKLGRTKNTAEKLKGRRV